MVGSFIQRAIARDADQAVYLKWADATSSPGGVASKEAAVRGFWQARPTMMDSTEQRCSAAEHDDLMRRVERLIAAYIGCIDQDISAAGRRSSRRMACIASRPAKTMSVVCQRVSSFAVDAACCTIVCRRPAASQYP